MCMSVWPKLCMCTMFMPVTSRGQKTALYSQILELLTVVNHYVGARNQTQSFRIVASALNSCAISPMPPHISFQLNYMDLECDLYR